jgi:ABC-type transport system substrate-binding protein
VFDFLSQFTIGDKDTLEGPDASTRAIGTGPFTLVEWIPGDRATFARHKNYWQSGRPYLDGFQAIFNRDAQVAAVKLEAGAVDFIGYPQTIDAVRLSTDPKYHVELIFDNGSNYVMWMNTTVAPFTNKAVRQAMSYAIDRKRFIDTSVAFGLACLRTTEERDLRFRPGKEQVAARGGWRHSPTPPSRQASRAWLSDNLVDSASRMQPRDWPQGHSARPHHSADSIMKPIHNW